MGKDRLFAIGLTLAVPLGLFTSACGPRGGTNAESRDPEVRGHKGVGTDERGAEG